MPKAFYKHKILLDEHLFHRRAYPALNEHFDVKHIKDDLHLGGMDDLFIYKLAVEQGRIILTRNVKHFRPLLREDSPGIIGKPGHLFDWTLHSQRFSCTMAPITFVDNSARSQRRIQKNKQHKSFLLIIEGITCSSENLPIVMRFETISICLSATPVSQHQTKLSTFRKTP